jgi:hypothetical protein
MYFSVIKNSFYPSDKRQDYEDAGSWPTDTQSVTPEEEVILRAAHANGDAITMGENGWVIEPKQPEPLANVKARLINAIDNEIDGIYKRFTRFSDEYREREAAARAFVAENYVGDPGPWVMGFATPAGKTASQAADIIILQADALKVALVNLGGLRMRKYEIASAADTVVAQTIHDDIVVQAKAAVVGL